MPSSSIIYEKSDGFHGLKEKTTNNLRGHLVPRLDNRPENAYNIVCYGYHRSNPFFVIRNERTLNMCQ